MAKNQNTFEKLQRERAKKRKADDKRERKRKKKLDDTQASTEPVQELPEGDEPSPE